MGFQKSVTDPAPPLPVALEHVEDKKFRLLTPFAYRSAAGHTVEVPAHGENESTDLASVPWPLWGLMAPYGRQLRAALLHDRLCDLVRDMPKETPAERAARYDARRSADDLFKEGLRDIGDASPAAVARRVSWSRAELFWAGVSAGREWEYHPRRIVVLGAHALAGTAALYTAAARRDRKALLAYLLLLAASAAWGRDRRLALVATVAAPVVLPVFAVGSAASAVLAVPEVVAHTLHPDTEPGGKVAPTVNLV